MVNRNSESGVSTGIRNTMTALQLDQPLAEKQNQKDFIIKIANTLEEREAVFRLAYQVYLEKGFIKSNYSEWLVQNYDAMSDTVILSVWDKNTKLVGSLTLIFDANFKLPAEKIYPDEIQKLKLKGEKLLEVSRLVISQEFRNSKEVLLLLYNYMLIYAFHVKQYDAMIIEVNPRHKTYYKTLLKYDEIGNEKECPSVQNAPAVLLYLPLHRYQAEVEYFSHQTNSSTKERSLYPHFLKPEQEKLVAYYLAKQVKPLNTEEKNYFGFSESGMRRAVCI